MKPLGARRRVISKSSPPVSLERFRKTIGSPVIGLTSGVVPVPGTSAGRESVCALTILPYRSAGLAQLAEAILVAREARSISRSTTRSSTA
jgi:Asp/Glu/hydantoin racemase